ncbi:MAG: site-specific integrase [Armatimonadetes bacterium]|nr:site-specific integrase [Armatimonadota bacterium]
MRSYGSGSFWWSPSKRTDGTVYKRAVGYVIASDGKKVYGTGKTKSAAETAAKTKVCAYESSLRTTPTGEDFDSLTLAEFAQRLLDSKKRISEKSVEKYQAYVGYLRSPDLAIKLGQGRACVLGEYKVRSVGAFELEAFMENVCERYAPKTAKEFRTWLITQFRKAVNYGVRSDNPARELEPISVPEAEAVDIPNEVLEALLGAAEGPRMKAALILMMHGLRFGEVFGLTWDDFDGNTATVCRQLQPKRLKEGERRELALIRRKKGGASYQARFDEDDMRTLVDSVELATPVEIWTERREGNRWISERLSGVRVVAPDASGKPWPESSFRRELKKLIDSVPQAKGLTPHDFRAWMATTLLDMGLPLKHVQKSLGHSRPETTLHYQRSSMEWSRSAHDKITEHRKGRVA